jgi:hypothetical protein
MKERKREKSKEERLNVCSGIMLKWFSGERIV